MKPTPLTIYKERRREGFDREMGKYRRSPLTDYGYNSVAFAESSGYYLRTPARSFWNIAGDYLKDEARHDFWSEATLFALITVTAALPLLNNLHALIQFTRAIITH
jgi:hypothetical protein